MDTLIIIGIVLGVVTGLCATVYEMAGARGRHRWGWTLAAFIGLCIAFVGWVVVAIGLFLIGPAKGAGWADRREVTAAARALG